MLARWALVGLLHYSARTKNKQVSALGIYEGFHRKLTPAFRVKLPLPRQPFLDPLGVVEQAADLAGLEARVELLQQQGQALLVFACSTHEACAASGGS